MTPAERVEAQSFLRSAGIESGSRAPNVVDVALLLSRLSAASMALALLRARLALQRCKNLECDAGHGSRHQGEVGRVRRKCSFDPTFSVWMIPTMRTSIGESKCLRSCFLGNAGDGFGIRYARCNPACRSMFTSPRRRIRAAEARVYS